MAQRLIGVDAGGTMTKAALFDLKGAELACARRRNGMLTPHSGWIERDPDAMWHAACEAIREVLEASNTAPGDIAAVSFTGYGGGLYLLDKAGAPARAGIVSSDSRIAPLIADWARAGIDDAILPYTHMRLWTGKSLALLAWVRDNEPAVLENTQKVIFCKDFLRFRMCGEFSTDPTDAAVAGLIDAATSNYAPEILDAAGLSFLADRLPPIAPAAEIAGTCTAEAARLSGLHEGTPVVRGAVDFVNAAMASGVVDGSRMSVVAGTFSINSTVHETPRISTPPFLQCPWPLGGFLATEGAATSASNLEWVVKNILKHEATGDVGEDQLYTLVNDAVTRRLGMPGEAVFLPYLFGGPAGAPSGLVGLRAGHGFDHVAQAVFEGIAYAHKSDIDVLLSGADAAKPETIRFAGGAARSPVWCDIFADVLELPLETPAGSELGALGGAILSAATVGAYPDLATAIGAMTKVANRHEPDRTRTAHHADSYARFRALAKGLPALWKLAESTHA